MQPAGLAQWGLSRTRPLHAGGEAHARTRHHCLQQLLDDDVAEEAVQAAAVAVLPGVARGINEALQGWKGCMCG